MGLTYLPYQRYVIIKYPLTLFYCNWSIHTLNVDVYHKNLIDVATKKDFMKKLAVSKSPKIMDFLYTIPQIMVMRKAPIAAKVPKIVSKVVHVQSTVNERFILSKNH